MKYILEYKIYSEDAILISWPSKIDEILLRDVQNFKTNIQNHYIQVIVEVVASYSSLLICYYSAIKNLYDEVKVLKTIYESSLGSVVLKNRLWEIPVCYDKDLAPDLKAFALSKSLAVNEIIRLHTAPLYTVYFIGFLPGFLYLGGLSNRLCFSRKSTPVFNVDKGGVAIGGNQTGVYPVSSPGGWHVIGKTPIDFFDIKSKPMCFAKPGDKISFTSIDRDKYNDISLLVAKKVYMLKNQLL